jgi:hypothetical protein
LTSFWRKRSVPVLLVRLVIPGIPARRIKR